MIIGEGEGVIAILGILDEGCDYVVGKFRSQGGVCEILERMLEGTLVSCIFVG